LRGTAKVKVVAALTFGGAARVKDVAALTFQGTPKVRWSLC